SGRKLLFAYNVPNQLVSFSKAHERGKASEVVERYSYSPDNERVTIEEVHGKKLTHFLWDGARPVDEWVQIGHEGETKDKGLLYLREPFGQLLEQLRYRRSTGVTTPDGDSSSDDPEDSDDDDGPSTKLAHLRWILPDHLGSSSLITNSHGHRLARLVYGPWGEPLDGNHARTRFTYTGHQREASTGSYYSVWRYLDPRAGKWTQRDPIHFVDGPNVYRYALNAPLVFFDFIGYHATTPAQKALYEAASSAITPALQYAADLGLCSLKAYFDSPRAEDVAETTCFKQCQREAKDRLDSKIESILKQFKQRNKEWQKGLSDQQIRDAVKQQALDAVYKQLPIPSKTRKVIEDILRPAFEPPPPPTPRPTPSPTPKP
ncbi:MAG: RHS repeat-associated core domain-containing protein, partial [Thermodesulfobacteriota bacterium]